MKKLILCLCIVSLSGLSGCAPVVTAMNKDNLTLRYDPSLTKFEAVEAKAESLCRENYGKKSRFIMSDPPSKLFIQYATFACE